MTSTFGRDSFSLLLSLSITNTNKHIPLNLWHTSHSLSLKHTLLTLSQTRTYYHLPPSHSFLLLLSLTHTLPTLAITLSLTHSPLSLSLAHLLGFNRDRNHPRNRTIIIRDTRGSKGTWQGPTVTPRQPYPHDCREWNQPTVTMAGDVTKGSQIWGIIVSA